MSIMTTTPDRTNRNGAIVARALLLSLALAAGCGGGVSGGDAGDDGAAGEADAAGDANADGDGIAGEDAAPDGPRLADSTQSECRVNPPSIGVTTQSECIAPPPGTIAAGSTTQAGCYTLGDPRIGETTKTPCLDAPTLGPVAISPCDGSGGDHPDVLEAVPGAGRFTLVHRYAAHNCCGTVSLGVSASGSTVTVTEEDVFDAEHPGCWCMCEYTISVDVLGLAAGTYTVRVVEAGSGVPYGADLSVTVGAPAGEFAAVAGPGRIDLAHRGAELNCCTTAHLAAAVDGTTVSVWEVEGGTPCFCECRFDLAASLRGVAPGSYTVRWLDGPGGIVVSPAIAVTVGPPSDRGDIAVEVFEDRLTVTHTDARWNCCGEVTMGFSVAGPVISVEEVETYPDGEPCRCNCLYDLAAKATGFAAGDYTVRVFTRRSGDETVFAEVPVSIPGSPLPHEEETLGATAVADWTVRLDHGAAPYNCCSEVSIDAVVSGSTIAVTERITNDDLCYCTCELDLSAVLGPLAAGSYDVTFAAADGRDIGTAQVTVGGSGTTPHPPEAFGVSVAGTTLTVTHASAEYNCCAEVDMLLRREGAALVLEEVVANPEEACRCMCAFDLAGTVEGLAPGATYTVRLVKGGATLHEETVTVE